MRARRQAERTRQRRRDALTLLTILVLLAPLAIGSFWVLSHVRSSSDGNSDVVLEVQSGWGPAQVGDALVRARVIPSAAEFQTIASSAGFTAYRAGRYDFVRGSDPRQALDTLRGGPAAVVPDIRLLLPPGLTVAQVADRIGRLPGKSKSRFQEIVASNVVRSQYLASGGSLEGLTWPDTYFVGANETETEILQRIVNQFDRQADALGLGAGAHGLSPYQTLIVASLVEAEAGSPADAPLIAAVIYNRLAKKMPLEVDATLCYAKGGCPPVPTDADRKIDSPYNTYKVVGLPPTPIKTVSAMSIKAALAPANVDYLYYVSDKHGKTYYASTLAEHERNVAKARSVK